MEIALISLSLICLGLLVLTVYLGHLYLNTRDELRKQEAQSMSEDAIFNKVESMAASALKGNAETFLNLAKSNLEQSSEISKLEMEKLLNPVKDSLAKLEAERKKSYTSVEMELKKVIEMGHDLNRETRALKDALKKPHVRGRWGEVQLKNCVELAGMSEYADVSFQDTTTDDEGRLHIPDMTVRMPGGRVIVVDAKTPLAAFITALEAPDEATRTTEFAKHGQQVKDHVKKLSSRAYTEALKDSADFTVMFLPNESFLYAALESQPDLMEFALQKKILIATPPTLVGLLKVIRFGWNEERLAENATRISEVGAELHKRLCDFVDAFVNVGKHLDKAKAEYETGKTRLQSRVIRQAEKLEKLGTKSHKTLGLSGDVELDH